MDLAQDDDPVADGRAVRRRRCGDLLAGHVGQQLTGWRPHPEPLAGRTDDVTEDGARLDGGQLLGVADEDQPGVGPHGLDEAGHHREGHHRRFVDDDHVVR
jgi:hypothetical protein